MRAAWERLLRKFGWRRRRKKVAAPTGSFALDAELADFVRTLAEREQRSADEMAADLLSRGLVQRNQELHVMVRWGRLSPREKQVAALLCQGYTNRQIAARFYISPETVKTYVSRILNKFGISSRAELKQLLLDEYGSGPALDDPR